MADRLLLSVSMCCGLVTSAITALQTSPPDQRAESAPHPAPSKTPAEASADVAAAIERATVALDRLEAQVGTGTDEITETLQALVDEANEAIETVQTQAPNNPWLSYLLGRAYALTGRRVDAADQLMAFVETREGRTEWRAYRLLGDLFVDEFPRLAEANYEKARRLNPREPNVAFGLSVCAMKRGDVAEAVRLVQEAMAAPGKPALRYTVHLAKTLNAAGRFDEALVEADNALRLARAAVDESPGLRDPLRALDAVCADSIDMLRARVNAATPAPADLYVRLAGLLRERSKVKTALTLHDALAVLKSGVERTSPNTPASLMQEYGVVLAEVGRTDAAIRTFEQLLARDPGNAAAAEWLRRLKKPPSPADPSQRP